MRLEKRNQNGAHYLPSASPIRQQKSSHQRGQSLRRSLLRNVIDRTETLNGCAIERVYVDKEYRGHDAQNPRRVFISRQKRVSAVPNTRVRDIS